jgi:hypothetical protein
MSSKRILLPTPRESAMDREAVSKKMEAMKAKYRVAKKAGKRELARGFRAGQKRLSRLLKATAPRNVKKSEGDAAEAAPAAKPAG